MQNLEKLAELALALPAPLKDNATALVERMGEVIEGFGDKPLEWRPETLKLVQGTSDRSKLPKGANIGAMILGEDVLEQPFPTIVARTWISRQMWDPNPENARMLCSSPDGVSGYQYGDCKLCPYSKFDTENNRSQCNKTLTMLNISGDLTKVFFTNFSKTNYANGVDFQSLMKKAGVAPYKRIYNLTSATSTKSKNVEIMKADPIMPDNKVEGPLLAFVEEFFRISGEDRKSALLSFNESLKARKESGLLLGGPDSHTVTLMPAEDIPVLENSNTTDVTEVTEVTGKVKKDYKL